MEQIDITPAQIASAKWPHEMFLINLVFNHMLVAAAAFGVFKTALWLGILAWLASFAICALIHFRARHIAASDASAFVKAHWQLAAKRNRHFVWMLAATSLVVGGGFWLSQTLGWSKIATIAILGGIGLLPFVLSMLVLIVLGNDAAHQAKQGKPPKSSSTNLISNG